MLPKHVRYQTALHPVRVVPTQATLIIIPESGDFVNTFFQKNPKKLKTGFTTWFSGYPTGAGSTGWRGAAPCMPARQAHVRPEAGTANRRPCKARATPGQGSCHRLPKPQHVVLHPPIIHHLWLSDAPLYTPARGYVTPPNPCCTALTGPSTYCGYIEFCNFYTQNIVFCLLTSCPHAPYNGTALHGRGSAPRLPITDTAHNNTPYKGVDPHDHHHYQARRTRCSL